MDPHISQRYFQFQYMLDGYINTNLASDVKFVKSTLRYLMTFTGEKFHGNQGCKYIALPITKVVAFTKIR